MTDKHIEALNMSVIGQNRELIKAKDLLIRWRNQCILPELQKELVDATNELLSGGVINHGLPEESCKEGC